MSAPDPITGAIAAALAGLSALTLSLDPVSRARLNALEGRCLRLLVTPPGGGTPQPWTVRITSDGLRFDGSSAQPAHVTLEGSLPDLVRMMIGTPANGLVEITGDESIIEMLADTLRHLEPDPTPVIERLLGPRLADELLGAAETGFSVLRSLAQAARDAAREQARSAFTAKADAEDLAERLAALKLRVDRLSARTRAVEDRQPVRGQKA